MPPAPKEARCSREQTSPHRFTCNNHLVRLPAQAEKYTLSNTQVELKRRLQLHASIANEVRRDATGTRVNITNADSSPVVWCIAGTRILLNCVPTGGPAYQEVNVAEFIVNDPCAVEACIVNRGKSLLVIHRPSCRVFFFQDVFLHPRSYSLCNLGTVAADEAVLRISTQGDHVVLLTSQQNIFVLGPKEWKSSQPVAPYPCRPGRSLWRFGSFFSKPEEPTVHACWSPGDESLIIVKTKTIEKWYDGQKVMEFALESGMDFQALQIQSPEIIHILYSWTPTKPLETADNETINGIKYSVGHYKGNALQAITHLQYQYPQASKCFVACSERVRPGQGTPHCIAVALDNLLVVTCEGQEDVLYDDFFMFGYSRTPQFLMLIRISGAWCLKFPAAEAEELATVEDIAILPAGVTSQNAVAHSRKIVDGSIANPANWALYAKPVDDVNSGTLMAKAIARKRATHRSFMNALKSAKIWEVMAQSDKRQIHEHGEKLSACHAVRKLQNELYTAKGPGAKAKPQNTQGFLLAVMEEVVAATASEHPNEVPMSMQEKFYSKATQVHCLLQHLTNFHDTPEKWNAILEEHGLTQYAAITFINQIFQEIFRAILAHRDVYGQQKAQQEMGRMEWTRKDDFLENITKQLVFTNAIVLDLAQQYKVPSDGLLAATEMIQRLTASTDASIVDPAGELLKQQALLVGYAMEFTAEDGRASPAAISLVHKYLMDYALQTTKSNEGRRRRTFIAQGAQEPARALAEKWKLFDLLIELSKKDPQGSPDAEMMQGYLRRFEHDGFHTALFDYYRTKGDWKSLLAIPGVDHELADYLETHNLSIAAIHRLHYVKSCDPEEVADQLYSSAALFQDAAQTQSDMRTRKASMSLAKLVLHLKMQREATAMDARRMTEINNELTIMKLQDVFLGEQVVYLEPEAAIKRLCTRALEIVNRQHQQDQLEAALQLNRQRVDCTPVERKECYKYIWAHTWKVEDDDWRRLNDLCREGAPDPEVKIYIENSLICKLRSSTEGPSLTPEVFTELRRNGTFAGADDRLVDALQDCLFAPTPSLASLPLAQVSALAELSQRVM